MMYGKSNNDPSKSTWNDETKCGLKMKSEIDFLLKKIKNR
jgi:hypothetical protein